MELNVPPIGGPDRNQGVRPRPAPAQEAAKTKGFSNVLSKAADVTVDTTPSAPPPELQSQIDRASQRYDELRAQQRELHFSSDPDTGRVIIQVRDLDGNVMRTIPPAKALDVISGAPLED
jgi:uncharacterized FlaG/YvyC family protein